MSKIKQVCQNILNTTNISEFLGFCGALRSYTCDTLNPFIEYDITEYIFSLLLNDDVMDRFDIKKNVPKKIFMKEFKHECLKTLSLLITSREGAIRFEKVYKLEMKKFNNQLQSLIDSSKECYMTACSFIINLHIHKPKLISDMNIHKIIGNSMFNCLDEKDNDILLKRVYCAYNYYNVGTDVKVMTNFVECLEKRQLSEKVLRSICNLLYTSMSGMKNYSLKERVKKIEAR